MKYADKVIGLLAVYPERAFVMRQIVRYIDPQAGCRERIAIKKAVQRVLVVLAATGHVTVAPAKTLGGSARYAWKTGT
jgi:hypothetical protein